MAVHDLIPEVNKCCFCCSIRVGGVLIALTTFFSIMTGGLAYSGSYCSVSDPYDYFMSLFLHVLLLLTLFMLFCAVIFLVGVCMQEPRTAIVFLYAVIAYTFMLMIYLFFYICGIILSIGRCDIPFVNLISLIFSVIIWVYFCRVLKSYYEEAAL